MRAPFPPLVTGGEGLDAPPAAPDALRRRMAAVYGVDEACILPVRGAAHGVEIVMRRVALDGFADVQTLDAPLMQRLTRLNFLTLVEERTDATGAVFIASPGLDGSPALHTSAVQNRLQQVLPSLLVLDESLIEFSDAPSAAQLATSADNVIVVRDLSAAYGLAGAPCGALIANAALIERLNDATDAQPLATPVQKLALAVLDPVRAAASARRIGDVKAERARIAASLEAAPTVSRAVEGGGPFVFVTPREEESTRAAIRLFALPGEWGADGAFRLDLRDAAANDRALAAFGVDAAARPARRAEVVRETLETRIVAQVDLDSSRAPEIDTGVGFFDHMLSQIAAHGGFSLALTCAGDLEVDAHHTIEDCALAMGQALKEALGAKRGLARFGFMLPMDEAEAKVSVDLSGRPYLVFEGAFEASHIGEYPTEMTEHVFRSLAQSMGAAIHVSVTGENDHHKTEACYKAFGRALRQAVRIEGEALPSTKGAL